jgi:hypothetical protein
LIRPGTVLQFSDTVVLEHGIDRLRLCGSSLEKRSVCLCRQF